MKSLTEWLLTIAVIVAIAGPPTCAVIYEVQWWLHSICWIPFTFVIVCGLFLSHRWPWR